MSHFAATHVPSATREASDLRVLAEALPAMIRAMAEPGGREPQARLGKISHRVAEHLGAEICSIFLRTRTSDDRNPKLVLEESFGYQQKAIGQEKSIESGLTARILKTPAEIVANFNVQDFPDWKGELDPELEWHCWCMLGVPIIGNNGEIKGVVKVENKRRHWSSLDRVTFIRKPGQKNTPKEIADAVEFIVEKAIKLEGVNNSAFLSLDQLQRLIDNFQEVSALLSAELPLADTPPHSDSHHVPDRLNPEMLDASMDSVSWYAKAVMVQLKQLQSHTNSLDKEITHAVSLLEAFSLSLSAYSPFSTDDLYLMRTVAAMIAAALDIREAAHLEAFHTLEHAVRRPGSNLLKLVASLSQNPADFGDVQKRLIDQIYKLALYISGPQALLQGWWSEQLRLKDFADFGGLFDRFLESRCLYYEGFAKLNGKEFVYPIDVGALPVASSKILNNPEVIIGALDILVVNAVEHGGDHIFCSVGCDSTHVRIMIEDNGMGLPEDVVKDLEDFAGPFSGDLYSPRKGVGLKFAKKALAEARMSLDFESVGPNRGVRASIRIPVRGN